MEIKDIITDQNVNHSNSDEISVLKKQISDLTNINNGLKSNISERDKKLSAYISLESKLKDKGIEDLENIPNIKELQSNYESTKKDFDLFKTKTSIAGQYNLSPVLASRLQGNTEDEIKADAELLQSQFSPKSKIDFVKPEKKSDIDPKADIQAKIIEELKKNNL